MTTLEIVWGAQDNWPLQGINRDGTIPQPGDFLATDTLTCSIWAGQNQTPLVTPTVVWASPAGYNTCLTFLAMTAAQSSILTPNEAYQLQIFVTRSGGDPVCVWWGELKILPAAGTGTSLTTTYAAYSDLEFFSPWLDEVLDEMTDVAGFYNYLLGGRKWIDRIIVNSFRPTQYIYKIANPLIPWGPAEAPNFVIEGYVQSDYVIVDDILKEIVARKALSFIADKMVSGAMDDPWPVRARYQRRLANNLVAGYRFRININSAPNVYISDPTGGGAYGLAMIGGGKVTAVNWRIKGNGYTAPTVALMNGSGVGATATAQFDPTSGEITGFTVTDGGAGYYQRQTSDIADNLGRHSTR